jgi:hypothetical protein
VENCIIKMTCSAPRWVITGVGEVVQASSICTMTATPQADWLPYDCGKIILQPQARDSC